MKKILVVLAFCSLVLGVNTADSARNPCEGGGAEDAMRCQEKTWQRAEKEVHEAYKQALSNIQKLKDAELTAKFKEAQDAWVKYRELQCSVAAKYEDSSSQWATVWKANCEAQFAKDRASYLNEMF